jgi:hypothetical protein
MKSPKVQSSEISCFSPQKKKVMDNKPESSKDGDGVSQNEEKKRKADKSQDQKKLRALDVTKLNESPNCLLFQKC